MKKRQKWGLLVAAIIGLTVTIVACDKAEDFASSAAASESEEAKVVDEEMGAMHGPEHIGKMLLPLFDECGLSERLEENATIEYSGDSYPKTIVVNHQCKEGEKRSTATIELTAPMKEAGAKQTITIDRAGEKFSESGTIIITNVGSTDRTAALTEQRYTIVASSTMSGPRGNGSRSFEGEAILLAGGDTETCDDDVFEVNGKGSGGREGDDGFASVIEAVIIDRSCEHPVQGVAQISGVRGSAEINFGNGSCDSEAEVTRNGETKTVDLNEMKNRRKHRRDRRN